MIGDILYHELKGKLTVSKKKYRRLGNKSVEVAMDENGKEHELDGTEIPYSEYELKDKKKQKESEAIDKVVSKIEVFKGDPGADADEDYIIEAVIPRVLEQIRQPEDGKDGADADTELIVREMLPLVMEKMPRPKEVNESLIIQKIVSRIRIPQDGKPGEKGKDGSPDTPVQVKEKLETLKGDERLDASAIKNLPKPTVQFGGGDSYTGLAKIDANGTPGTLQDKLIAGSGITITKTNDTLVFVGSAGGGVSDTAYDASSWDGVTDVAPSKNAVRDKIEAMLGSSGITRTVVVTSGSATMGSSASTDYAYFVAGAHTMSLPAASGNTNRYTVKNNHSANITVDTVGAETIEGVASISIAPQESVDIMSNGTNFYVI